LTGAILLPFADWVLMQIKVMFRGVMTGSFMWALAVCNVALLSALLVAAVLQLPLASGCCGCDLVNTLSLIRIENAQPFCNA
jgi:hypothetical protein